MKRFAVLLCLTPALFADFQLADWRYQKPLVLELESSPQVWTVDRETYIHSQPGLADLRVISGAAEIPYVVERMSGSHRRVDVAVGILDQGVNAKGDLELTVDVGMENARHNALRIATARTNFRQQVTVSTSNDGHAWAIVRNDGALFDFSQQNRHVSILDIAYPVSTRRYVRLTVHGWTDPNAVSQVWVSHDEDQQPVRDQMATLKAEPQQDEKTRSTLFTWDLGVAGIPHDQLTLEIATLAFERAATIESSVDGKQWFGIGQGVVSRFRKDQAVTLEFPQSHERYLRLRIYNRDDQPLSVESATLSSVRTRLRFKPVANSSYALFYGNSDARTPSYDLGSILAREARFAEGSVQAGPEKPNPAFREKPPPAKPWSEQHPEVLYVTLAVAVVAMGIVTVRFLKKVTAS